MAVQTLFHRRYSGMIGIGHVGVTVLALDLFHATVDIVAEGYGLLRADGAMGELVKYENKCRNKQSGAQGG